MFRHVDAYPGDPILTLNEDFQKDPRQGKINLSIGIYFDEEAMDRSQRHTFTTAPPSPSRAPQQATKNSRS